VTFGAALARRHPPCFMPNPLTSNSDQTPGGPLRAPAGAGDRARRERGFRAGMLAANPPRG
jgi:hypothetical protein